MVASERDALSKYAKNKARALEIGSYMGVSANIIAKSLSRDGMLYCIDPFPDRKGKKNPGLSIMERQLIRSGVLSKVKVIQAFSTDSSILPQIPNQLDFIFVDGDHRYEGLQSDWAIVQKKLAKDGIVCLHDTIVPANEPTRVFGSVKFFQDVIKNDSNFELLEECYSMNILKRLT